MIPFRSSWSTSTFASTTTVLTSSRASRRVRSMRSTTALTSIRSSRASRSTRSSTASMSIRSTTWSMSIRSTTWSMSMAATTGGASSVTTDWSTALASSRSVSTRPLRAGRALREPVRGRRSVARGHRSLRVRGPRRRAGGDQPVHGHAEEINEQLRLLDHHGIERDADVEAVLVPERSDVHEAAEPRPERVHALDRRATDVGGADHAPAPPW